MHLLSFLAVSCSILSFANAVPLRQSHTVDRDSVAASPVPVYEAGTTAAPLKDARRRRPPRDSGGVSGDGGMVNSHFSEIENARMSAFSVASQAQAGATPAPNRIVCPGVIGAAPIPSKASSDEVHIRKDPNAIKFLQGRDDKPPQGRRHKHEPTTTQAVVQRRDAVPRTSLFSKIEGGERSKRCEDSEGKLSKRCGHDHDNEAVLLTKRCKDDGDKLVKRCGHDHDDEAVSLTKHCKDDGDKLTKRCGHDHDDEEVSLTKRCKHDDDQLSKRCKHDDKDEETMLTNAIIESPILSPKPDLETTDSTTSNNDKISFEKRSETPISAAPSGSSTSIRPSVPEVPMEIGKTMLAPSIFSQPPVASASTSASTSSPGDVQEADDNAEYELIIELEERDEDDEDNGDEDILVKRESVKYPDWCYHGKESGAIRIANGSGDPI